MSYTTTAQVRLHLLSAEPVRSEPIEQPVTLSGTDWRTFYSGPVLIASIAVASQQYTELVRQTVRLVEGAFTLPNPPLQPNSLVVASDSSLGHTYLENRDYHIDYRTGRITRKTGGDLLADHLVTVWCRAERHYVRDLDYQIEAARGRLRRVASGGIADGETVLLRFEPSYSAFPDDIVEQATAEANRLIESTIDPLAEFGADPVLAQASTYTALAIVCRGAATRDLAGDTGRDRTAAVWLSLADSYHQLSQQLLTSFRPPMARPHPPRLT